MSYWQLIFLQSKVNRGAYDGDRLPRQNWDWPQQTWFQKRLRYFRKTQQILQCKGRAGPSQYEYKEKKLQRHIAFKEIGNGMPTMLDRQRGEIPGPY